MIKLKDIKEKIAEPRKGIQHAPRHHGPFQWIDSYHLSAKDISELSKLINDSQKMDFMGVDVRAGLFEWNGEKVIIFKTQENNNFQDVPNESSMGDYFIKIKSGWRLPTNSEYTVIYNNLGDVL